MFLLSLLILLFFLLLMLMVNLFWPIWEEEVFLLFFFSSFLLFFFSSFLLFFFSSFLLFFFSSFLLFFFSSFLLFLSSFFFLLSSFFFLFSSLSSFPLSSFLFPHDFSQLFWPTLILNRKFLLPNFLPMESISLSVLKRRFFFLSSFLSLPLSSLLSFSLFLLF